MKDLDNYDRRVDSSFKILDITMNLVPRHDYDISKVYMNLFRRVDGVILTSWILPSRLFIRVSCITLIDRLEVTSRILEEL